MSTTDEVRIPLKDGDAHRGLRSYKADGTQNMALGVRRPSSNEARLIIDVWPYTCCCWSTPEILAEETVTRIPEAVAKAGVDSMTWRRHMCYIRDAMQAHSVSVMSQVWFYGTVLCMYYPLAKARKANDAVRQAVDVFNREALEPRGLFAKTQKGVAGSGKSRQEITWLTIALTPAESRVLQDEPHIYRYNFLKTELYPITENSCCEMTELCGTPIVI